jgi:hypothetical protein
MESSDVVAMTDACEGVPSGEAGPDEKRIIPAENRTGTLLACASS